MTGPEHYAAAEHELSQVHEESDGTWALARAQAATAHATLALAAATALAHAAESMPAVDCDQWHETVSEA